MMNARPAKLGGEALPKRQSSLSGAALYMAIFVITVWLGMLVWLTIESRSAQEVVWSRLLVVLTSLEAVAFGAAGALFGSQIQRQRVADAKDRAEKAEAESTEYKDTATRGKALAAAVKAEARTRSSTQGTEMLSVDAGASPESAAVAIANSLFPDA